MDAVEYLEAAVDQEHRHAGPMVPRMILGARLRALRESMGISREEAGEAIRASHSKISRLELARIGCKLRDVADLLTLYGVSGEDERATLLELAQHANTPGWWSAYSDVTPHWLHAYLGLEQAASLIRTYEVQFVPGLLQTAGYARAVISLGDIGVSESRVERGVELRMGRQQILHRAHPPRLWAVLDEAALRRPIGGAAVMRAQIQHLIEAADMPHITIQILPFTAGGHAASGGPITILRLPERVLPDVVYLEQLASALYPDRPADVAHYTHVMNRLATEAAPAVETPALLHRILRDT
ncbi:helix-turn-helix transcriptional regulator [Spongiactinospora sp. TRM90649]|nr:helix-turn-helix transcriptional regulator [Spongiactinospora sp. TRM90649]MDF5753219.1 helix-turn-helix transcriptional regulator [Spongiactinospora sp. TRM90649]